MVLLGGGAEVIEAGILELGAAPVLEPEVVMAGRDDEPDPGAAELLPVADAEPVAAALPDPKLDKPLTTTDVG